MAYELPFPAVWAENSPNLREPTVSELDQGFECGAAGLRELHNFLFQDVQQAINALSLGNGRNDIPINGWQSAPPGSPAPGDRYVVLPTGTGAFAAHDNQIAMWTGDDWVFTDPVSGLQANYVSGTNFVVIWFDGSIWQQPARTLGLITVFGPGSTSWVCPPNVTSVKATGHGGGGGGGGSSTGSGAGGGGSGGAVFIGVYPVVPGVSYAVVVGAGGSGGQGGVSGGAGGVTSFSTFATAPGGNGGSGATTAPTGGGAGTAPATGGLVNWPGGTGSGGSIVSGALVGGTGGGSYGQGACNLPASGSGTGITGGLPGIGGNGGGAATGGAGGPGQLVLEY